VGVGGRVVAEEAGDVDGVGGEVAEVEGVEVECWEIRLVPFGLFFGFLFFWPIGLGWVGLGWFGMGCSIPRTMRVATR
jgi:hypothetical protein